MTLLKNIISPIARSPQRVGLLPLVLGLFLIFIPSCDEYSWADEVAKTIAMEACGEGRKGMWAVANVINNRAMLQGSSPSKVIAQPYQFDGFTHPNKELRYRECKEIADWLSNNIHELEDITKGATHYANLNTVQPYWAEEFKRTVRIGGHTFFRESDEKDKRLVRQDRSTNIRYKFQTKNEQN